MFGNIRIDFSAISLRELTGGQISDDDLFLEEFKAQLQGQPEGMHIMRESGQLTERDLLQALPLQGKDRILIVSSEYLED